jgi:hypothetical protein
MTEDEIKSSTFLAYNKVLIIQPHHVVKNIDIKINDLLVWQFITISRHANGASNFVV